MVCEWCDAGSLGDALAHKCFFLPAAKQQQQQQLPGLSAAAAAADGGGASATGQQHVLRTDSSRAVQVNMRVRKAFGIATWALHECLPVLWRVWTHAPGAGAKHDGWNR